MVNLIQIALLCCYPLFVHLSIALQDPLYRIYALVLLTIGILFKLLLHKNWVAWLTLFAVVVITLIAAQIDKWWYAFYLPPILLPAIIASIFIRSLLHGNEPLVTAIGERARGPLSAEMKRYTRRVTLLWATVLCIMTILGALLPIFSSEQSWSVYTNFISYISIAVLFVGEFLYRRIRFKNHNHPNFRQYLQIVLHAGKSNRPNE